MKSNLPLAFVFLSSLLLVTLLATPAQSDQAMNCIVNNQGGSQPKAWVFPARTTTWTDIGTMTLTAHEASDVLVNARVGFSEDNVPGSKIVYRMLVNGSVASRAFVRRLPPNFPQTQMTHGYLANVAAGDLEVKLQATNPSNNDIYFFNLTLSAIYLDDANDTDEAFTSSDISFTGGWTTLGSVSINLPAGDVVFLGATTRISAGTPGSDLEFRFVDTTPLVDEEIYVFDAATPDVMTDGLMLARFYNPETTSSGTRTFAFQARNVNGLSTVVRAPFFYAQTLPEYQLYESDPSAVPASVTLDGQYHTVVTSQEEPPSSASRGDSVGNNYRSYSVGVATFTPEAVTSGSEEPMRWRQQMVINGNDMSFDSGLMWGHVEDDLQLGNNLGGGCGFCGWQPGSDYRVELRAQAVCGTSGSTAKVDVPSASVQLMLIPNFVWFDTSNCSGLSWKECCALSSVTDCNYECNGPSLSSEQHDRVTCP